MFYFINLQNLSCIIIVYTMFVKICNCRIFNVESVEML